MTGTITEEDWDTLIERIEKGECAPFLGAGISTPHLPLGWQIAKDWAEKHKYPLGDAYDLPRVSQFLALKGPDKLYPKGLIRKEFENRIRDIFTGEGKLNLVAPHHHLGILAKLPFPVYITTNYDDLLFRALRANGKEPTLEVCAWNVLLKKNSSAVYPPSGSSNFETVEVEEFVKTRLTSKSRAKFTPTAAAPLIYHLHGHYKNLDSMVLTENDYLDFLVNVSRDDMVLPIRVYDALARASILFIGYSLADPDFRVLFRGLIHPLAENKRLSVSIQLPPGDIDEPNRAAAQEYLAKYFEDINIKVFWGKAEEFVEKLWDRWNRRA